jgi:hypothetical protein
MRQDTSIALAHAIIANGEAFRASSEDYGYVWGQLELTLVTGGPFARCYILRNSANTPAQEHARSRDNVFHLITDRVVLAQCARVAAQKGAGVS